MGIKVSKLWSNSKFSSLTINSKLLYIYLGTNASINSVGVLMPNIDVICIELGMTIEEVRESTKELVLHKYLLVDKIDGILFFTLPAHFNSLPKSNSTILKVTKDLKELPNRLRRKLEIIGISVDRKAISFIKPTLEEVNSYAISMGYLIDGQAFIDYYEETANRYGRKDIWLDSRGKQVKDWKGKLRKVWFKEERKLTPCKGAPKGYEYFFIELDGELKTPDGWRDGKPYSKNFLINKQLQKTYEERKGNS